MRSRSCSFRAAVACAALTLPLDAAPASAQNAPPNATSSAPPPAAGPAASAGATGDAASPLPIGLRFDTKAETTYVDRGTTGPGQVGPEAAGFIKGSPLSPQTPYDLFSSAPEVPGIAAIAEVFSTATVRTKAIEAGVTAGFGYVNGSVTNAPYWGENLLPTLNPHVGSQALPYAIAFPGHAGEDDATAVRLSLLGATIASADGNERLRGGWFDLTQTDRFVFVPPQLTNANPAIAYAPAESLSNGVASAAFWQSDAASLPLRGLDATAKRGDASLELTSAALPSLPGERAQLTMGSIVFDRGEGTRFSAQLLHATTGGLPFSTTIPSGADPQFFSTPQGTLPESTLNGQRQTIAGLRAAFHVIPFQAVDGVVEVGRAWYDATPVDRPGTEAPGGFYHLGFSKTQGRITASVDVYREEPRYATLILPYGVPENQWSAAFAWPGNWLKSNYQVADNTVLGVNRQGYRFRYFVDKGPLEVHVEYTDLRQIDPETTLTSTQAGYVDGYYLPQEPDGTTLGRQRRYAFWTAWHPKFGDLSLDVVDDTENRPFVAKYPGDQVSYEVPQAVVTYDRSISQNVTVATGAGRYAMKGAFSTPIDLSERLFFLGTQIRETKTTALLVSYRRTVFGGRSVDPAGPVSPAFTGSALVVEQRLHL